MSFPDALGYDAWRDELAVPCPYATDWESARTHGPILPPDVPALSAGIPSSHSVTSDPVAGRHSAVAPGLYSSPGRGRADHPVDPDF